MLQFIAYFFASFAPPYPIFVSVFTLNGMGFGLQDALANVRLPSHHLLLLPYSYLTKARVTHSHRTSSLPI
jgi:hypothetical protein